MSEVDKAIKNIVRRYGSIGNTEELKIELLILVLEAQKEQIMEQLDAS